MQAIKKNKVATINEITDLLHCSLRTARTRLKKWGAISSFNKNGKYYTLPNIARFNTCGIWHYQGIGFSEYGNLKQTFIHLIRNSEAGLSGREIGEILSLDPRSFVSHFRDMAEIQREKIGGSYVHFLSESASYQNQRYHRIERISHKKPDVLQSSVAILVLVEKIKHPELDASGLSKRLRSKKVHPSSQKLSDFFVYHGIEKKLQFLFSQEITRTIRLFN